MIIWTSCFINIRNVVLDKKKNNHFLKFILVQHLYTETLLAAKAVLFFLGEFRIAREFNKEAFKAHIFVFLSPNIVG